MFINAIRKYVKKAIRVIQNVKALQGRRKVIQAGITKNGCMEEEVGPEKVRRIWLSENWGMAAQRVMPEVKTGKFLLKSVFSEGPLEKAC